jgi:hypothetical protein
MRRASAALQSVLLLLATSPIGCASIFNGKYQDVHFAMSPPGTTVSVYQWEGTRIAGPQDASTETLKVHRPQHRRPYLVIASKEGYCPKYWLTESKETLAYNLDALLVLGALLPGLIAAAVDSTSGAGFQIDPETFAGSLKPEAECVHQ